MSSNYDLEELKVGLQKEGVNSGARLIGVQGIDEITPTDHDVGEGSDLQAMLEGFRDWMSGGSGGLTDAVILAPDSITRNTIIPTAVGYHNLTLKSIASQTSRHIRGLNSSDVEQWYITPSGDASFSNGLYSGTLGVTGIASLALPRFSAFTTQYTIPYVTNSSGDLGASTALTFNSSTGTFGSQNGTFSGTMNITSTLTLGASVLMNNTQQITIKNASGVTRNVLTVDSGNRTVLGGTVDGGINFLVNLGNDGGYIGNSGDWHMPSTLTVTGAIISQSTSTLYRNVGTSLLAIGGGSSTTDGANIVLYGGSHATDANEWAIRHGTTPDIAYNGTQINVSRVTEFEEYVGFQERLAFSGNGTPTTAAIWRSVIDGMVARGIAGSSYDLVLQESGGSHLFRNPQGGTVVEFPGTSVSINGSLIVGSNATIGLNDNSTSAFLVQQASNKYLEVSTTNSAEYINIGNSITNPHTTVQGGSANILTVGSSINLKDTRLEVLGGSGISSGILLASSNNDATVKEARVKGAHYTNAEEPITGILLNATSSTNVLYVGGGSSLENSATSIRFHTGANNTTLNGTDRGGFNSSGVFDIVGGQTIGGTLSVNGITSLALPRFSAFTTQYTIPFVTNTSGDLGASTALTFNSSTGTFGSQNGTFSGTIDVTGLATFRSDIVSRSSSTLYREIATSLITIAGGNSSADGANLVLYGGSHATLANDFSLRQGTNSVIYYDYSENYFNVSINEFNASWNINVANNLHFGAIGGAGSNRINYSSTNGLRVIGGGGSTYDLVLGTNTYTSVLRIISGTNNISIGGGVYLSGLLEGGDGQFSNTLHVGNALTNGALYGTGTRLVTATSGGVLGNATTISGNYTLSGTLTLSADPTTSLQAATKQYVDAIAAGIQVKTAVAVSTTANITLSGEQTIDGVTTSASRVLVKNQTTTSQNGIYVSGAGAWTRSTDTDAGSELVGALVFVSGGTVNGNTQYFQTAPSTITIGSTSIVWELFYSSAAYVGGTGIVKTGNTFDVVTASSSRIVVNADSIDLATTGVSASSYPMVTVDAYGRVTAGNAAITATTGNFSSTLTGVASTFSGLVTASIGLAVTTTTALRNTVTDSYTGISGDIALSSGAALHLYGSAHATLANDFSLRSQNSNIVYYDQSVGSLTVTADIIAQLSLSVSGNSTFTGSIISGNTSSIYRNVTTSYLSLYGGNSGANGAGIVLYGGSHASLANDFAITSNNGATNVLYYDHSALRLTIGSATTFSSAVTLSYLTNTSWAAGGIVYDNGSGLATASSGFTWISSLLNATGSAQFSGSLRAGTTLTVSGLTAGRIPYIGTAGLISEDALYWDPTNNRVGIGSGAASPLYELHVSANRDGPAGIFIDNDHNGSSAGAVVYLKVGYNTSFNPMITYEVSGYSQWCHGISNADADNYVIASGTNLSSNVALAIGAGRNVYAYRLENTRYLSANTHWIHAHATGEATTNYLYFESNDESSLDVKMIGDDTTGNILRRKTSIGTSGGTRTQTLHVHGSVGRAVTSTSSDITLADTESVIYCTNSGAMYITLPVGTSGMIGREYWVYTNAATYYVTLNRSSTNTMDLIGGGLSTNQTSITLNNGSYNAFRITYVATGKWVVVRI